jgi:ABC-type phosphate transport system auxiliary subunit
MSTKEDTMKAWYKSKTFWLNLATLGVASALEQPNPETMAQLLALANLILRFFTTQPIGTRSDL